MPRLDCISEVRTRRAAFWRKMRHEALIDARHCQAIIAIHARAFSRNTPRLIMRTPAQKSCRDDAGMRHFGQPANRILTILI